MNTNQLYRERLTRYLTALRNEKPDRIPIRPFVAEFTAKYAGMTCQQVAHDYNLAFEAAVKCAKEFDWDAIVPNMVYVWTGLAQAAGLRYYGIPGIGIPHTTGFNFIEPPEDQAFMREDEYDALIDDPTGFLYNVWLPRISTEIAPIGAPATYRNNLSLVKSSMAMMVYFSAFGPQIQRLRDECGTVSAIAGIFKAPFDILGDKLRGYIGLTMDMVTQPEKVLKACEALMPHLTHVGLTTADPAKQVPIGFWMHRGCVPFITPKQFQSHYWPTLKPCIEEFWKHGQQTMFYAEGKWDHHLDDFATLPARSILFHVDQGDIFLAHKKLHHKFALSGGIPNVLLSYGKPDEVRAHCKKVIDAVAKDGGYIMDASAIMQDDTSIENLRALTDFTREYGVYSAGRTGVAPVSNVENDPALKLETGATPVLRPCDGAGVSELTGLIGRAAPRIRPGICRPWEEKAKELPPITGDQDLVRRVWENVEALGNTYIWQLLLSFLTIMGLERKSLLLVACRVFERELEVLARSAKTALQIHYIEIALHQQPGVRLRAALQEAVNTVQVGDCDAVALGYGLCNQGLVGLQAHGLPVVIPRAHDCLGILLGSTRRYLAELEKEPGTYFQSCGWIEHLPADRTLRPLAAGADLSVNKEVFVARFGEESAQFLMEEYAKFTRHYKRLGFIATPVAKAEERERKAAEIAQQQGWAFERLPGDLGWLRRLVDGEWKEHEFLVLKPYEKVALSYADGLIAAEPS